MVKLSFNIVLMVSILRILFVSTITSLFISFSINEIVYVVYVEQTSTDNTVSKKLEDSKASGLEEC